MSMKAGVAELDRRLNREQGVTRARGLDARCASEVGAGKGSGGCRD